PLGNCCVQISFPGSAPSASTRLPAGKYITLLATIGVASGLAVAPGGAPPRPRAPPEPAALSAPPAAAVLSPSGASPRRPPAGPGLPNRNDQAGASFATFFVLIC